MTNIAKSYAQLLGVVLTLVGILGFINVTPLVSDGRILSIFAIDPLHNVIHLASGIVGLAAGFMSQGKYARTYAGVFGLVYGLVTVLGFVQGTSVLGLVTVNAADNFLHTAIAVASLGVYFLSGNKSASVQTA